MPYAIITGASAGIGRELALFCAEAGYDLVLIARNEAALRELAAGTGRKARILAIDLARQSAPEEIFAAVRDVLPETEILINNAGFGLCGYFDQMDVNGVMEMIQVNVTALTHLTRLFLPGMIARGSGRILNVASTAAFQPGPLMAVYYATKAYVLSFSEALQNELRGRGVTVTTLCPGPTVTEFQKRAGISSTRLFASGRTMDAKTVADIGFKAMMAGRSTVTAGTLNAIGAFLTRFVPRSLTAALARKLQE
jgi:short-subunit dehydrogenase